MTDEMARTIIDANSYLTLATADADGKPWATPVWFAPDDYTDFIWLSRPTTRHSANIAARPDVAIVVFDSTVPINQGQAVYVEAVAEEVPAADVERAPTAAGPTGWRTSSNRPTSGSTGPGRWFTTCWTRTTAASRSPRAGGFRTCPMRGRNTG
jgi:Pyridoxamine 5'-phosphate oxidase